MGLTFTASVLPPPLSVPDAVGKSQELLPASVVAVHETGRAHVPVSLKVTFWAAAVVDPWGTENERLAGKFDSVHGGRTVSVTENFCGLPCAAAPEPSAAAIVICAVYVPAVRPAIVAVTPMLPDCPVPLIVGPEGVSESQLAAGATLVFHVNGQTQLPVPVNVTVCCAGESPPCIALKDSELEEGGDRAQGGCTTRLIVIVCPLPAAEDPFESVPPRTTCPT